MKKIIIYFTIFIVSSCLVNAHSTSEKSDSNQIEKYLDKILIENGFRSYKVQGNLVSFQMYNLVNNYSIIIICLSSSKSKVDPFINLLIVANMDKIVYLQDVRSFGSNALSYHSYLNDKNVFIIKDGHNLSGSKRYFFYEKGTNILYLTDFIDEECELLLNLKFDLNRMKIPIVCDLQNFSEVTLNKIE